MTCPSGMTPARRRPGQAQREVVGLRARRDQVDPVERRGKQGRKALGEDVQRLGENRSRILTENINLDEKLTGLTTEIAAAERTVLERRFAEACDRLIRVRHGQLQED